MPLAPHLTLQAFEKWAIDFMGPINPPGKHTGARYIITTTKYLTRWVEARGVKDYSETIATHLIFDDIITKFGCPKIPISDQGTHFINKTIEALTQKFEVHHQKSTPYHPQVNGTVESFNKILEIALTNIYSVNRDDWDLRVPIVLWAYRTTCKKLIMQTPFKLVYGLEVVVPMEYLVPSLRIVAFIDMDDTGIVQERLAQLVKLEEDRFIATHWMGSYEVAYVTEGGVAQLNTLNGEWKEGLVNGSRLKLYYDNQLPHSSQ
jgi:hypothetical protein